MVVLKWINSILSGKCTESSQAAAGQGAEEKIKKDRDTKHVDLVNAALIDKAEDLDDLITAGSPFIQRKKLKGKIKERVRKVISKEFYDEDVIEEVTEKITDVAEVDSFYKNLFFNKFD